MKQTLNDHFDEVEKMFNGFLKFIIHSRVENNKILTKWWTHIYTNKKKTRLF